MVLPLTSSHRGPVFEFTPSHRGSVVVIYPEPQVVKSESHRGSFASATGGVKLMSEYSLSPFC